MSTDYSHEIAKAAQIPDRLQRALYIVEVKTESLGSM